VINIFLSASVPLPNRDPRFMATADVIAIRDSVKALVTEVVPRGVIVFGGHPAITPLVALLLRGLGPDAARRIILYQSAFFTEQFGKENDEFLDVRVIPAVLNSEKESLRSMRAHMIGDTRFHAGVFIGGMDGVLDEFVLFGQLHPNAARWPIASTGAAAKELFIEQGARRPELFADEMTYSTLFRRLLSDLPPSAR
jgi:hypothetical protein